MSVLTTHVLDLTRGEPACGLGIALARLDEVTASVTPIIRTITNTDGRTDQALLAGADLSPGRYVLEFAVGEYFAGGGDSAGVPYLDVVPIRFGVAAGTGHLHVALLVTPWSYTTYRGS
jgi:hydroxyisourate hydrolase